MLDRMNPPPSSIATTLPPCELRSRAAIKGADEPGVERLTVSQQ
jgi:hypothetical protein